MTEAQEILDKLTEAQKRTLRCAHPEGRNNVKGGPAYYIACGYNKTTGQILHSKGIAETPTRMFILTETGLAVRALLEKRT